MRYLSILLLGLGVTAALPSESRAQPLGFYSSGYRYGVNPYVPPTYRAYSSFASPYGYRTFSSYTAYPTPFGYNTAYNTGTAVRPYVSGPFHSVYFDPFANTYRYTSGYLNTPTVAYGAYGLNPYLPFANTYTSGYLNTPTVVYGAYGLNPYLNVNPYAVYGPP